MAKQGIGDFSAAPSVKARTDVNFQPSQSRGATPTYTAPGVQQQVSNLSGAGLVANTVASLIPGAVQGYENHQVGNALRAVDTEYDKYEAGYQANEAAQNISALELKSNDIWDNAGSDVNALNKLGVIDKTVDMNMKTLVAAKGQGKISEAELLVRINKVTREAINKNPWLEQEIYGRVQGHLKAAGISDVIKERTDTAEAISKKVEDEYKHIRNAMEQRNLPWEPGMQLPDMVATLNQDLVRKKNVEVVKDALDSGEHQDQLVLREQVRNGGIIKAHQLEVDDFQKNMITKLSTSTGAADYQNTVASLDLEVEKKLRDWKKVLGNNLFTEQGKQFLAEVEKDYRSVSKVIKEAGSGKTAAEYLKNRLSAVEDTQKLDLRGKYNVDELDLYNRLGTALGESMKDAITKAGGATQKSIATRWMSLMSPKNSGEKEVTSAISSGFGNTALKEVLGKVNNLSVEDSNQALVSIVSTTNRAIASGKIPPTESRTALNGMLATIAQNAPAMAGRPITPDFTREVGVAVDSTMQAVVPELMTSIDTVMKNSPGENKIVLDVLPNGSFIIKTNDPNADAKFNRKFSNQINNAIDAYAVANGVSREKAATTFYTKHFGTLLAGDKDILDKPPLVPGKESFDGSLPLNGVVDGVKNKGTLEKWW